MQPFDSQGSALKYLIIPAKIQDNKDAQSSKYSSRPIYHPSHQSREVQTINSPTLSYYHVSVNITIPILD